MLGESGNEHSATNLAKKIGLELLSPQERRTRLLAITEPFVDETFKAIVENRSDENLDEDNFFSKCLLERMLGVQSEEELRQLFAGIPEKLDKIRIQLPDIQLVFEGMQLILQRTEKLPFLDIANSATHATTIENALSDVQAGSFRPAEFFGENKNSTISWAMAEGDDQSKVFYREYVDKGHDQKVFFSSTVFGNLMYQAKLYAHGKSPVVFWLDKEEIAALSLPQEADHSLLRYAGENRVKGAVPVRLSKAVFIDISKVTNEQRAEIEAVAPVLDIKILAVLDFVASLGKRYAPDNGLFDASNLPRQEFTFETNSRKPKPDHLAVHVAGTNAQTRRERAQESQGAT